MKSVRIHIILLLIIHLVTNLNVSGQLNYKYEFFGSGHQINWFDTSKYGSINKLNINLFDDNNQLEFPTWSDNSGNLKLFFDGQQIKNSQNLPLLNNQTIQYNNQFYFNLVKFNIAFFYSPDENEDSIYFFYRKKTSINNRTFKIYFAVIDNNPALSRPRLISKDNELINEEFYESFDYSYHSNGKDLILFTQNYDFPNQKHWFKSYHIQFPINKTINHASDSISINGEMDIYLFQNFNPDYLQISPNSSYLLGNLFHNRSNGHLFHKNNIKIKIKDQLFIDSDTFSFSSVFIGTKKYFYLFSKLYFQNGINHLFSIYTDSSVDNFGNPSYFNRVLVWTKLDSNLNEISSPKIIYDSLDFTFKRVFNNFYVSPKGDLFFVFNERGITPFNNRKEAIFNKVKIVNDSIHIIDSFFIFDDITKGTVKPTFSFNYFRTPRIKNTCRGDTTRLSYVGIYRDSARWIFDDPSSGNANTQSGYNVWHVFSDTGLFQCKLLLFSEGIADTFTIPVRINGYPKAITPIDTFICPYTPFAFSTLAGMDRIRWNNNDTHSFKLLYPGNYWVEQSLNGCTVRDSISIKADTLQAYVSSLSPAPCFNQNFQIIDSSYGGIRSFVSHNFRVDTLSFSDTFNIIESRDTLQLLWVAQSALGCLDSLSLQWVNQPKPQGSLSLSSDTLLCLNSPLISWQSSVQHHLPITQSSFLWDGALPTHAINDQGELFIQPADSSSGIHTLAHFWSDSLGCSDTLFRSVQLAALPQGVILADTLVCAQSPFSISLVPLDTSVLYGAWYEDFNFRFALSGDVDTSFQSRLGLAGIYSYQWVIRNSSFCYDTLELRQEILDLAPIAIQNWDSLVCPNQNLNLIWDSSNFNQQVAYWDAQWFRGGQADGPVITRPYAWDNRIPDAADTSFTRQLQLSSTHINGCRDSLILTQRILPRPQAQLLVLDSSFCAQNGFYRLQEQSPSDLPLSITWTSSSGAAGVLNPQDQLYLPAPLSGGSQGLQVIYTNIHQCRDTFNQLLFFENPPLALWTLSDSILCQNQNLNLSYQAENLSYDSLTLWNSDSTLSLNRGSGNYSLSLNASVAGNFSLVRRMQSLNQCAYQYSKIIQVNPAPIAAFQDSLACLNQDTRVINQSSISSGSIQSSYWNLAGLYDTLIGGIADFSYSIPRPGLWDLSLILRSDLNCLDTFNQQIRVYPLAQPQILVEDQIFNPPYIQLQLRAQNRNSRPIELWQWSSSLHQLQGEQVVLDFPVEQAGYYRIRLSATDTLGCSASTDSLWSIFPPTLLYIPNAFSPDQNQNNDLWRPLGLDYAISYQLIIYNRWGQILLDTQDPKQAWDGRFQNQALPQGIYYFHLRAVSRENELIQKAGEILLVR